MEDKAYHSYSRILHWTMALLLFYMVFLGWSLEERDTLRLARFNMHKSLGMLILLLTFVRIGLRFAYKAPAAVAMPKWQELMAKGMVIIFYVLMIGLPLSGWLLVSTTARPIPFFGLFEIPHLPVAQNRDTHEFFEFGHGLQAKLLIYGLIPLHILAAIKHHFVDKDMTMSHMIPGLTPTKGAVKWLAPVLVILVALAAATFLLKGTPQADRPAPPVEAQAQSSMAANETVSSEAVSVSASSQVTAPDMAKNIDWTLNRTKTRVMFTTLYLGKTVKGNLVINEAKITFSPEALTRASVRISFDLAATRSGDADRDNALIGDNFFSTDRYPVAVFAAKTFSKTDENQYVAEGTLNLRGKTMPVKLPFTLNIKGKTASLTASTSIDRLAFGVGKGEFASPQTIPALVDIDIVLFASHD